MFHPFRCSGSDQIFILIVSKLLNSAFLGLCLDCNFGFTRGALTWALGIYLKDDYSTLLILICNKSFVSVLVYLIFCYMSYL